MLGDNYVVANTPKVSRRSDFVAEIMFVRNRSARPFSNSCYDVTGVKVVSTVGEVPVISSAAFGEFYDHALDEVFRYLARSVLGNRAAAEDLTQETFAAAAVAARAGRVEALTMPWVMGVARHKLIDHYRRAARDERHLALAWADTSESAELDVLDSTDLTVVLEMLRDLSPEHRLVLILKYVDELSAQEIATMLDRSLPATKSLLSRARRALAGSLKESQT
jgi:RNA polymerase sigma-70 factor (ECF subfamily)